MAEGGEALSRGGGAIVAEGIFAAQMPALLEAAGVPFDAWYIDQSPVTTAVRRFARDVAERRKPPLVLVRRGARLWRDEPELVRAHLARGAQPVTFSEAVRRAATLQSSAL